MKMKRNPAVEVFRCLLMLMIVLSHVTSGGIYADYSDIWKALVVLPLAWHVDGFIAISGWFGIKFSWHKVVRLCGLFVFYSALSVLYLCLFRPESLTWKSFVVKSGWFGGSYVMLMCMAPIINEGVLALSKKGIGMAWRAWLPVALCLFLAWFPTHLMTGIDPAGLGGNTVVTLIFVYMTARLLALTIDQLPVKRLLTFGLMAYPIGLILVNLLEVVHVSVSGSESGHWRFFYWVGYQAPYVWMFALAMLYVFVRYVKVPYYVGRIACWMSPSLLGVYLLHETTSFGRLIYAIPQQYLSQNMHPVIVVLLTAIETFVICILVDVVRRMAVSAVEHVLRCYIKR